jgi:hypothetical protein
VIDPDEQAQAVVRPIFDPFDREATLHGLLRYPVHHHSRIPVRVAGGPPKGRLQWRRPDRATPQDLRRHPSYAGAYRFGHRPTGPRKQQPGRPSTGKLIRRPEECLVLLRDRLPASISWERFEADQERRAANRNPPSAPGAPRNGPAPLAGLVRRGRCGRRMVARYGGPKRSVSYTCTRGSADYGEPLCQGLSDAGTLEELVAGRLLAVVQPAALEASLAAVTADKASARAEVALHGVGGAARSHTITRPVARYGQQSDYQRLVARLRESCSGRRDWAEVAQRLDAEGFRPPKRAEQFSGEVVRRLTVHLGLLRRQRHGSTTGLGPDEYRPMGLARRLGISRDAVRRWPRAGWLNARRDDDRQHVIWADSSELRRLREPHDLPRTWANKKRLARLKKPKPRPAR